MRKLWIGLVTTLAACNETSMSGSGAREVAPRSQASDTGTGSGVDVASDEGSDVPVRDTGSGESRPTEPKLAPQPSPDGKPPAGPEEASPPEAADVPAPAPAPGPAVVPDAPADDPLASVDAACVADGYTDATEIAPPTPPLPGTVPADCRTGVEFNNYRGAFELRASTGARGLKLEVDVASYAVADRIRIVGVLATGEVLLFDSCRLATSAYRDPTGGGERPPEDAIRSFRVAMPEGTTALRFDLSAARSPSYLRIVGLCDFAASPEVVQGEAPNLRGI